MCVMDAVNQIGAADVRPDDAREGTPDDSVLPSGSCATPVCRSRCRAGTGPDQPTGSGPHSHAGKRAPRREGAVRHLLPDVAHASGRANQQWWRSGRLVSGRRSEREVVVLWHGARIRTLKSVRHKTKAPHSHAGKRAPRREGAVRHLLPDVAHASGRANQQWWRSGRLVSGRRSEREVVVLWHGARIRTLKSVRHEGRGRCVAFCPTWRTPPGVRTSLMNQRARASLTILA